MIFIELCVALALSILSPCNGHKNATINETAGLNQEYIKTVGEKETLQNSTDKRSSQKSDGSNDAKSNDDLYVSGLTEQIFKNIDGYKVKDVVSAPNYPDNPDEQNAIPNIDIPSTGYKGYTNFGERIFGYFKAPLDGEYIFNISSNNNGQLMISTNTDKANLRIYAEVKGPVIVKYGEFDRLERQGSMPIPMNAGEMYYLQVLHKALFGLNHVQVGALFPDKTKHYPLESKYFFTLKDMKKEGEPLDGNGDLNNNSSNSGGGLGSDGGGGGGAGGGNSSAVVADPLEAALDAGQKAGIANGAEAGSKAGENAGKRAGEDAGAKAGAEAGLRAAASALGISVEQLKEQKAEREANKKLGFKFRFYSANFKCSQPGGYVCKYAISTEEDNTVQLNPRESAATFILRKPGLSGKIGSASFELDYRRGVFLKKDGSVLTVGANDGSKQFAKLASFSIDSQNSVFPATYGIRLYENPDVYVCHADGTSDLVISKLSDNCAFFMVPIELDMNSFQPSCKDFCQQEEKPLAQNRAPNNNFAPVDNKEATIETLHLLDALARHAASVATEKTVQDRIASERIAAIARLQAEHKMKADSHFFENLHHELDEGQHMHGQQYITVHFRNRAGPPGKIRIKSSIKPEGYLLGEDTFKLRIVFKHQFLSEVIFSGVDEREKPQQILLDGQKELKITPSVNPADMKDVVVTAVQDTNGHSLAYLRSISGSPNLPVTSPLKGIDNPQAKKNLTSELNLKDTICKHKTYGGNSNIGCCTFPFIFNDRVYHNCIQQSDSQKEWCSTTTNFDEDKKWGYCHVDTQNHDGTHNHEKCPEHCAVSCLYTCNPICCKAEIPMMTVPRVLPTQITKLAPYTEQNYPTQQNYPLQQNSYYQSLLPATTSLVSKCHPSCISQCGAWCNPLCCSNRFNNYVTRRNVFPGAIYKRNIIPVHKKKSQKLERDIIEGSIRKHSLRRKKEAFEILDNF